MQCGNGGKVVYEHDGFDRLTGIKYDNDTNAYEYGTNGQEAVPKDYNLTRIYCTECDIAERPFIVGWVFNGTAWMVCIFNEGETFE